jgi:hypothetical protein
MIFRKIVIVAFFLALVLTIGGETASAANNGTSLPIIATGKQREELKATPIINRPSRPLHFYGNTVRRIHNRRTH